MMIYIFTCSTEGCIYNLEPVNMCDPSNPVLCGACFTYTDAVETAEPCPTLSELAEVVPEPAPKGK